ncbi:MAG TPA: hypothetical protein VE262_26145 [Blastocatellia bacterium]|nr:hypothetical protein [Blastocatellia bacterium]
MHALKKIFLLLVFVSVAAAQSPEPPLSDSRLTIHTLLREDIFAGFLTDDMERFGRGERNIQLLLEKRPADKASLLAWKAGAMLYRAVRAHENNRKEEFEKNYQQALDLFAQAGKLNPADGGVVAVTGGSYALFADRLPEPYRAAAWAQAYASYNELWKHQSPIVDKLPPHLKGELLGGLAQSAQRTGRTEEMTQHLDKILAVMRDTPYESIAKQWKKDPAAAAGTSITCLSCHDSGRLAPSITALKNK